MATGGAGEEKMYPVRARIVAAAVASCALGASGWLGEGCAASEGKDQNLLQPEIIRSDLGSNADDPSIKLNELGVKAFRERQFTDAEQFYARAIDEARKKPNQEQTMAVIYNNLSLLYHAIGREKDADSARQRSLDVQSRIFNYRAGRLPDGSAVMAGADWEKLFATGCHAKENGDYRQAERQLEASLRSAETFGADDKRVAMSATMLAGLYLHTNQPVEAESLYRRSLPIVELSAGSESLPVANILDNIGQALSAQLRFSDAEAMHRRAFAIYKNNGSKTDGDLALCLNNLALVENKLGRKVEAEADFSQALKLSRRSAGAASAQAAIIMDNLAGTYLEEKKYARAEALRQQALPIFEKTMGPRHPEVSTCLNNLAATLCAEGKFEQAEPLYRRALGIQQTVFGNLSPEVRSTAKRYAAVLRKLHREAQATSMDEIAGFTEVSTDGEMKSDLEIRGSRNPAIEYCERGLLLLKAHKFDEALADFDQAVRLDPDISPAYGGRALIRLQQGAYRAAIADFDRSLSLNPGSAASYRNRGHAYCMLSDYRRGVDDLDQAVRRDPQFPSSYLYRGEAYYYLGDYGKAVEDLSRYLDLNADDPEALNLRGQAYEKLGKKDLAGNDLQAARQAGRTHR